MSRPTTSTGQQLYDLLPEVYRSRDRDRPGDGGDLAAYLDACGELLDLIRNTLDQRLADSFPDRPPAGRAVQEWLLPYFAQLLDVRLVSPHADGRRQEVARAVSWRQRKGTFTILEEIAEAVAQTNVEVHEGWKRVAVTPRVALPLEPADLPRPLDMTNPSQAARHPGLPAVTPDLRRGVGVPGSHEDATRRTVDVRLPTWQHGHYHPRRLLLFAPPPTGFPPERTLETLTVGSDRPQLTGVAARSVVVEAAGGETPVLDARDCLFGSVEAAGLVRLEHCTVLGDLVAERILASDCLFAGDVEITGPDGQDASCIRYSRIPPRLATLSEGRLRRPATTTEAPAFYDSELGTPASGVLHPATPEAIRFGAEDGGEMGAFHHRRYCLQWAAVLDKLKDFLPVGIEAALVPDPRLLTEPPADDDG